MNKYDFITTLKRRLKHLPKEDFEDAIAYYTEYLEEMGADAQSDVTSKLGTPEDAAREIIANCTEKHINNQKEKGSIKNSTTIIRMTILAILASPIAIPLAAVAITLLAVILCTFIILILALGCMGVALAGSGILLFVSILFAAGIAQKLVCCGLGFCFLGVGILLILATILLSKSYACAIAALFQKMFIRKKVEL